MHFFFPVIKLKGLLSQPNQSPCKLGFFSSLLDISFGIISHGHGVLMNSCSRCLWYVGISTLQWDFDLKSPSQKKIIKIKQCSQLINSFQATMET